MQSSLTAHAAGGLHVPGGGGDAAVVRRQAAFLRLGPVSVRPGEEGRPGGAEIRAPTGDPGAPAQPPEPERQLQQRSGETCTAAQS